MSAGDAGSEKLGDRPIQSFLATKEVVVLATIGRDGAPLAMPMWFLHSTEALFMISVADSQKVRNLGRDGRVSVVAETGTRGADIKNLMVQGRAEPLPDSPQRRELIQRFLDKYRPHLSALWGGETMPANRVMYRITPERVRSRGL